MPDAVAQLGDLAKARRESLLGDEAALELGPQRLVRDGVLKLSEVKELELAC